MPDLADLECAAWLVCLGQCLRLERKRSSPSLPPQNPTETLLLLSKGPRGLHAPRDGLICPPEMRCLEISTSKPHQKPPWFRGLVPGVCPHPLCSVQPVLSPFCCHVQVGSVSLARPHPVLSPHRSWSGPWSRTARMRSPLPSTPLPPTRARSSAAATPARRPPRRPGEPPALRRGCTAVAGKAPCAGTWRGVLLHVSQPQKGASGISSLGSGKTKPREMNEARSWLKNPCKALKSEQLRGPESHAGSVWNGKNQLPGVGSAHLRSKTPGAGRLGPHASWLSALETSGLFDLLLLGRRAPWGSLAPRAVGSPPGAVPWP